MTTGTDPLAFLDAEHHGHEGHSITYVSMSWGERAECDDCRIVIGVWNDSGDDVPEGNPAWIYRD